MSDTQSAARGDPPALAALKAAFRQQAERPLGETGPHGEPCIAVLGGGFPAELAIAAGTRPVMVRPDLTVRPTHAGRYMRPSMPASVSRRLDMLLDGTLGGAALAVMTSRFEIDALLYHAAKAVLMRGEAPDMPPMHLFVLLTEALDSARTYSRLQARALAGRLEAVSGVPPTEARIAEAITALNGVRASLARLTAQRLQGRVSGVDSLQAIAAARSLPPADAQRLLEAWLGAVSPAAGLTARPRLLVTTSAELCHTGLHAALEGAGALVALEDGDWGARSFGPPIALDGRTPFDAVVDATLLHTPNPAVYPHTARLGWFYDQARRPEIDAAVFHIPADEAPLGWDYPRLARFMEALGKPYLLVRDDPATPQGRAALEAATRQFLQTARLKVEA